MGIEAEISLLVKFQIPFIPREMSISDEISFGSSTITAISAGCSESTLTISEYLQDKKLKSDEESSEKRA